MNILSPITLSLRGYPPRRLSGINSNTLRSFSFRASARVSLLTVCLLLASASLKAQLGYQDDYNDGSLGAWTTDAQYPLAETGGALVVGPCAKTQLNANFSLNLGGEINITSTPILTLRVRSNQTLQLRVDLMDATNAVNSPKVQRSVTSSGTYSDYTFDFSSVTGVNRARITQLVFYFQPGVFSFTGTVRLDSLVLGSGGSSVNVTTSSIRLNQVGFMPQLPKKAAVIGSGSGAFEILTADDKQVVYTGTLSGANTWPHTGESVRIADFTDLESPGEYVLHVPGFGVSYPFEISLAAAYDPLTYTARSFYYSRCSSPVTALNGGTWARAAGHPDNNVRIHSSAASASRPTNTIVSSPGGWYDAGDYGKYLPSAAISVFNLLSAYEHHSAMFDTLDLNIPESGNSVPDILDEVRYELDWLLTMQEPTEGFVYHKLTTLNFVGDVMPNVAGGQRYMIGYTTPATLDFAAMMAMAARIYQPFDPTFAATCSTRAVQAYNWAVANPNVYYSQPGDVSTGAYGDNNSADEFAWARAELFITTGNAAYKPSAAAFNSAWLPGWNNMYTLGLISLIRHKTDLASDFEAAWESRLLVIANEHRNHANFVSAYRVPMGRDNFNFNWGSNAIAGNMGMILGTAYKLTGDDSYLEAEIGVYDYLLGRNGTNYSFVSGLGEKTPLDFHHRPSFADGIPAPVPGHMVGGPHNNVVGDCDEINYPSSLRGARYIDEYCSYSTNENAVNYTAPMIFVAADILDAGKMVTCGSLNVSGGPSSGGYCEGDNLGFKVTTSGTGLTHQWRRGLSPLSNVAPYSGTKTDSLSITALSSSEAGSYDLLVTDLCGSTATIPAFSISVSPKPNLVVTEPTAVCAPSTINLTTGIWTDAASTSGTVSYYSNATLSTSVSTPTAVADSGRYYILKTSGVCSDTAEALLTINTGAPAVPTITEYFTTLTSSVAPAYQWYLDNSIETDSTSRTYVMESTGTYRVDVTNACGTTSSADRVVTVLSVPTEALKAGLRLYPNPSAGLVTLEWDGSSVGSGQLRLLDLWGREQQVQGWNGSSASFDLGDLPAGRYVLLLDLGDQQVALPLIKR